MNDKLGFYTVNGKKFDKKIQALIYATKLYRSIGKNFNPTQLIKWNFNNEIFNEYKWCYEPSESLKTLYYRRAKLLREKYDYIIVSYSGGSDSHNILHSFLDQGLHIDELFIVCLEKIQSQFTEISLENTDAKYAHISDNIYQTLPRLRELAPYLTKTKITYADVSNLIFDVFENSKDESWIMSMREELNPVDVARYNYSSFSDFRKRLDKFQNIGVIVGIDKPKLIIDSTTNLCYLRFIDRLANTIPIGEYTTEYSNTTVEFFYWSPDSCDMLCKQAHVVKRWLEENPKFQIFYETIPNQVLYSFAHSNIRNFNERILRHLLYDNWNQNWFQSDKNKWDWFTESDLWFISGAKETNANKIWRQGIKFIIDNTKPFISTYNSTPDRFLTWHHDYLLGKMENKKSVYST